MFLNWVCYCFILLRSYSFHFAGALPNEISSQCVKLMYGFAELHELADLPIRRAEGKATKGHILHQPDLTEV